MTFGQLILKNTLRKKMRFTLTSLSIAIAFFLFTALAGVDHALNSSVANSNQFRLMTRHKISLTRSLPVSYQQKIQSIAGVAQVSYASWFGGFFQNESEQLSVMAVNSDNYLALFPEYQLAPQQLRDWQKNRIGLLISEKIARRYQWHIGDRVPLNTTLWMNKEGSFSWEFVVAGIYRPKDAATNDNNLFFHHDYFDENRAYNRYSVSWFSLLLDTDADTDAVSHAIDAEFANSSGATRSTTEQVFLKERTQQFVDLAALLTLVLAAVFFTLLLIVCNSVWQGIRERQPELAIMKAMGFSITQLLTQLFCECFLLLLFGALLGSTCAALSLGLLQQLMADYLPGIAITASHYGQVLLLVTGCTLACCIFPGLAIKRNTIVSALGAHA